MHELRACIGSSSAPACDSLPGSRKGDGADRRYALDDPHDRRRVLTAYGRGDDDIEPEIVVELTDEGYVRIGDRATVSQAERLETLIEVLPACSPGLALGEIHNAWPSSPAPGKRTLDRDIKDAVASGRVIREGQPYRYSCREGAIPSTPTPSGARNASEPPTQAVEETNGGQDA